MTPAAEAPHDANADAAVAALLVLVDELIGGLGEAVTLARRIGPEWENVVEDIRTPVVGQLSDLSERLSSRMDHRTGVTLE